VKPLFIPIKRRFFEEFESGAKTEEFRLHGPRWNERNCYPGRAVILSLGYGKQRRLKGTIIGTRIVRDSREVPGINDCYGPGPFVIIAIGIRLEK